MAACLPATQFCCGFTITCGVKFIMLFNLAVNVCIIGLITSHLIFDAYGGIASYSNEMRCLAFCLTGVPIILSSYHGILYRNYTQVRMYFWYMSVGFAVLLIITLWDLVFTPACGHLLEQAQTGSAWACGASRYIHIILTISILFSLGYFTHVVHSYCEDLAECGGGPELKDLVLNKEAYLKRYQPDNPYASIEGRDAKKGADWFFSEELAYGTGNPIDNALIGMSDGYPIFKQYHDMTYPPCALATSGADVPTPSTI